MNKLLLLLFVLLLAPGPLAAQVASGGNYTLDQTVVANGGGTSTNAGNNYKVEATSGQPAAGTFSSNGNFAVRGGFWAPNSLAPTTAGVSISGRVAGLGGEGLRSVYVTLSGGTLLVPRNTRTNTFGNFTFEDVEAGQIYTISVRNKKYGFPQDTQIIMPLDSISDLVFQAAWEN